MQNRNVVIALIAGLAIGWTVAGHPAKADTPAAPAYEYLWEQLPSGSLRTKKTNELAAQGWEPTMALRTDYDRYDTLFRRPKH